MFTIKMESEFHHIRGVHTYVHTYKILLKIFVQLEPLSFSHPANIQPIESGASSPVHQKCFYQSAW